jgi:hypothetical protein
MENGQLKNDEKAKFPYRKLVFEFGWEKRVPIFAFGFASPSELVLIVWPIKFCLALRY